MNVAKAKRTISPMDSGVGWCLKICQLTSQYDVKCQQKTRGGFPLIDFTKNRKPKSPCAKQYFLDIYTYFTFISFHLFGKILALVLEKGTESPLSLKEEIVRLRPSED